MKIGDHEQLGALFVAGGEFAGGLGITLGIMGKTRAGAFDGPGADGVAGHF